jgi:hypothetical protein
VVKNSSGHDLMFFGVVHLVWECSERLTAVEEFRSWRHLSETMHEATRFWIEAATAVLKMSRTFIHALGLKTRKL